MIQAQVFVEQLKKELKLHQLANGDGTPHNPAFIDRAYQMLDTFTSEKSRAMITIALGNWLRLGKRESSAAADLKQAQNNVQININLIQPASMQEVMDSIPEVK